MRIRKMTLEDKGTVVGMMEVFYASSAVHSNGSSEIFNSDVDNCVGDNPFIEGYVFEDGEKTVGYGMLAKSFSTEFGKPCIWIEDLYIKDEHRGQGIGRAFLDFVSEKYSDAVIRLEAERENERAVYVYEKNGFRTLPYIEMIKL